LSTSQIHIGIGQAASLSDAADDDLVIRSVIRARSPMGSALPHLGVTLCGV
jgi:hypothetical protein